MRCLCCLLLTIVATMASPFAVVADDAPDLRAIDAANPWYPNAELPPLRTPEWVGEDGVEAVVVFAIDDMRDSAHYERYLRPILNRLKQIDGRAPVSIMTCDADPQDPQLQSWLEEGLSIEAHTADHPCPILHGGELSRATSTYNRCVDLLYTIPGNQPVAFRTPCCDSLNTVSPRFYAEVFSGVTENDHFLQIDSSVFNFFTSDDPSIPRELVLDEDGQERFLKYRPRHLKRGEHVHDNFVNVIRNYPWPYVINGTCWQFPCVAPSDWSAQHLHGVNNPRTVADWKAALDITVQQQGVFCLVFHPHGWIDAEQIVELIDHAVTTHGSKVKFLNFREAADRLNASLTSGRPLRQASDDRVAELSHQAHRAAHPAAGDLAAVDADLLTLLAEHQEAPFTITRPDGTHSGVFVDGDAFCWLNEFTADRPDMLHRVSFDELRAAERRRERHARLPPVAVGAAVEDITPDFPVRLSGYASRREEAAEVAARIHARALVIGGPPGAAVEDEDGAADSASVVVAADIPLTVLLTVDNCGVPATVADTVFRRLADQYPLRRERFAVSSTHTHSAPWLPDFAPLLSTDLPEDHAAHQQQYQAELVDRLVRVVSNAIGARRPGRLSVGFGHVGFAVNRRVLQDGQWTGFGETADGPVDRRLSVLAAHDPSGDLIAVLANYACHATTETGQLNRISGDWPGFAADMLEADHDGAVALIAIGCGADANPSPRGTHELSRTHGRALADGVNQLLATAADDGAAATESGEARIRGLQPVDPRIECQWLEIDLPHGPLPARDEWERRAQQPGTTGDHARWFLDRLDRGETIPDVVADYPVQTWCFGEDLAMVFLGGEVVVDYSIRLNEMFDSDRLWITAYSNAMPCYIASRRILREGGYEADSSMMYYARPTRLAPEAEDRICDAVQKLLPHHFYSEPLQVDFPAPLSPEAALTTFQTRPDLRVEQVAAEPLIRDPVAFDWDVNGRLWVVEMGDYPSGTEQSDGGGRIRVLEDRDHDGRYDTATTFLEGLPFPTGLCHWRDGLLITAAPDILFARDTDGDLRADERRVLYTGFGEGNQQHRVNGLRWGLDGWLYLGNGDSGGTVRAVGNLLDLTVAARAADRTVSSGSPEDTSPTAAANVRGRDVRIQPDAGQIATATGQTQFGRERDDFGNWFGNNNSNPIWHYALREQDLNRNPHYAAGDPRRQIAVEPGAARVYPVSRTLARFNDFHAANRFTSACSTAIYRDFVLGDAYHGSAFICEPVHNLVSRLTLRRDGASFLAERAEDERSSEFLASSDNWFRPTMVRTGPDGALYVSDMYRFVIEHPTWIPAEYQRKLNLRAGESRGRIYRIVPAAGCCGTTIAESPGPDAALPAADLRGWWEQPVSRIPTGELVARLASPNGWWRDTAHRLLQHRGETAVAEQVAALARSTDLPAEAQVQCLHVAVQLLADDAGSEAAAAVRSAVRSALASDHPEVRRNAVRVAEAWIDDPDVFSAATLRQLQRDPSAAVVMQLAISLGEIRTDTAARTLAELVTSHADNDLIVAAAFSSLHEDNVAAVLRQAAEASSDAPVAARLFADLIGQAAAMGQSDAVTPAFRILLQALQDDRSGDAADRWQAAARAVRQLRRRPPADAAGDALDHLGAEWTTSRSRAEQLVSDASVDATVRAACVDFLSAGRAIDGQQADRLLPLLNPATPPAVQRAIVSAAAESPIADVPERLLSAWPDAAPALRAAILDALLQREALVDSVLNALAEERIAVREVGAVHRDRLLGHRNPRIRGRAAELFRSSSDPSRSALVDEWIARLESLIGDVAAGREVFRKRCAACHRLEDIGKSIGADLSALRDRSTEALVTAVLDPNRAVEAKFLSYTAVTNDGLTRSGMLLGESANSLTLIGTDGQEHVVLRDDLEELIASQKSLMPEGLEKDLTPQDLADVIAWVRTAGQSWKSFAGNRPQPVSADDDGTLTLPAAAAEIYGPSLVFETRYENLGWWQSTDDYAIWTIDVPRSGHWTVEVDYACDEGTAGNLMRLSTGTRMLTARVPGTGTWDDYRRWTAGTIDLHAGRRQLVVTAPESPSSALIDLRSIRLIPPE